MTLPFFDAYCALGPLSVPPFGQEFRTAGDLLHTLDEVGIAEALVYSTVARELDAVTGNTEMMLDIGSITEKGGARRLHPCWVVMPHHTGEMPPPDELIGVLRENDVHAVRMYPGPDGHNFTLSNWCSGPLLKALAGARVPLFLDLVGAPWGTAVALGWDALGTWDRIAALLADYPTLPLVLTGVTFRIDRYLYPLWEMYRNLYIETSGYQAHAGIEVAVRRFGPERLLFGTSLPRFSAGAAMAAISYAEISPEAKRLIAGDNLRCLLGATYGN